MADTGVGVTLAFGTSTTFTPEIISLTPDNIEVENVGSTHLGSTKKTSYPSKTEQPGGFTCSWNYDPDVVPPLKVVQTITVNWPLPAGKTTPAKWEGTGYIDNWTPGTATIEGDTEENMVGEFHIKWDGLTGPTFTASVA